MADKKSIKVLQIGSNNWQNIYSLPDDIKWYFYQAADLGALSQQIKEEKIRSFNVVLLEEASDLLSLESYAKYIDPYTVLVNAQSERPTSKEGKFVWQLFQARLTSWEEPERLIEDIRKYFFTGQYGDKLITRAVEAHHSFLGKVVTDGYQGLWFEGKFGKNFQPLGIWKNNFQYDGKQELEFWLEYLKEGACQLRLRLQFIKIGAVDNVYKEVLLEESDLTRAYVIEEDESVYIAASLEAKGRGRIKIGSLHQRFSRGKYGKFLLGGEIQADHQRQELIYYFHPGDCKPPLNVYFSGFRPAEGFEGYYMMKSLGSPFVLVGDPRLEGGSFYMGSKELEQQVVDYIQDKLNYLGFKSDQLTMSGLSMGTFGALYYGVDFNPKAIVVGKPLVNIGDVALNLKFKRPDEFGTSLDMMRLIVGEPSRQGAELLNQKFWDKFDQAHFDETTLALAYMKDDDYDQNAYGDILERLYDSPTRIISKNRPGRHNDASGAIIEWFFKQYQVLLEKEFGRKFE